MVDPDCRPNINLVQLVDQAAANAIDELTNALMMVGCKLARHGMGEFVARALIKCWHLVKDQHYACHMRPIEEFKQEEEHQKDYFLASIKQGKRSDEVMAERLAMDLCKVFMSDLSKESEWLCKRVVNKHLARLGRRALQEASDAHLGTQNIDAQRRNILEPAAAIEDDFDFEFEQVQKQADEACENELERECQLRLMRMSSYIEAILHLPGMEPENTMSEQVFVVVGEHSGGPAVTRALKTWAAGQWLRSSFLDAEPAEEWETPDLWSVGRLNVRVRLGRLRQYKGPVDEVQLHEAVREAWQHLDDTHIGCIHLVLHKMARVLQDSSSDLSRKLKQEFNSHLERTRLELRNALVPCRAWCPCCGRICDNTELGTGHIHHCRSGHQCRGFMGVYMQDGQRTASTRICSQSKDKDIYIDSQGKEWAWRDFKEFRSDWDFSDKFDSCTPDFQVRMLRAWETVGPHICQHFGTRWTAIGRDQTFSSTPLHFILVLDSSYSIARP